MAIKSFKPYSAGRRFMTVASFDEITTDKPEKSLVESLKSHGGRNQQGRMTVRHQGGGHKRRYRIIDFKRTKDGIPARVATIEYDPNRSARIALLNYADGEKRYILAPNGLKVGDKVESGAEADIKVGNALPIKNIPVGTMIHNIELKIGKGAQLARSAGSAVQLMAKENDYALLRLPSGKRPENRGVAMNPNDHPHGGGEGRSPVGRKHPVTKWGKCAMGAKTRRKKASDKLIVRGRK